MNMEEMNVAAKQPASVAGACDKRTVLLVDDDAKLLRGLCRALAEEDYEVVTAISAAEAHAIVALNDIDLILCDNLMVGTLGLEFLTAVRREFPNIVLMMLSGYLPESAAVRAKAEIGISRILNKPCSAADIAIAVREELERARA